MIKSLSHLTIFYNYWHQLLASGGEFFGSYDDDIRKV